MKIKFLIITAFITVFCLSISAAEITDKYYEYADSADHCMAESKWQKAEEFLLKALRERPADINNSLLLNNLGNVRLNSGNTFQAIEAYNLGLSLTPNSLVLLKNRASAFLEADSLNNALSDVEHALEIQPDDRWCIKTHGLILIEQNRFEDALTEFYKLLEKEPEAEDILKVTVSAEVSAKMFANAEKHAAVLTRVHPSAENWYLQATVFIMNDKLTDADDAVYNGLALDNRCGELYMLKAYLSMKRYRPEDADMEKKLAVEYGADPVLIEKMMIELTKNK